MLLAKQLTIANMIREQQLGLKQEKWLVVGG